MGSMNDITWSRNSYTRASTVYANQLGTTWHMLSDEKKNYFWQYRLFTYAKDFVKNPNVLGACGIQVIQEAIRDCLVEYAVSRGYTETTGRFISGRYIHKPLSNVVITDPLALSVKKSLEPSLSTDELEDGIKLILELLDKQTFCNAFVNLLKNGMFHSESSLERGNLLIPKKYLSDEELTKLLPYGRREILGDEIDSYLDEHKEFFLQELRDNRIPLFETDPYGYVQYFIKHRDGVEDEPEAEVMVPDSLVRAFSDKVPFDEIRSTDTRARDTVEIFNNRISADMGSLMDTLRDVPRITAKYYTELEQDRLHRKVAGRMRMLCASMAKHAAINYCTAMKKIHEKGAFHYVPKESSHLEYDLLVSKKEVWLHDEDEADDYYYGHLFMYVSSGKAVKIWFEGGLGEILRSNGYEVHPHISGTSPSGLCWGNLNPSVVDAISGKAVEILGESGNGSHIDYNVAHNVHKYLEATQFDFSDIDKVGKDLSYALVVNDWYKYSQLIWALLHQWDEDSPYIVLSNENLMGVDDEDEPNYMRLYENYDDGDDLRCAIEFRDGTAIRKAADYLDKDAFGNEFKRRYDWYFSEALFEEEDATEEVENEGE